MAGTRRACALYSARDSSHVWPSGRRRDSAPSLPFLPGPAPLGSSSASSAFSAETCRWGCARPLRRWSAKVKVSQRGVPPGGTGPGSGVRRCTREGQSGPSEQFEVTTRFLCGGTAEGDILLGRSSELLPCRDCSV